MMTDRTQLEDEFEDEIDQMAEARIRIEEDLADRKNELDKIGDFGEARCSAFYHNEHEDADSTSVVFEFTLPDGEIGQKRFDLVAEAASLEGFIDSHDADSVTDMVGAKHAAVYTNDGWFLLDQRKINPNMYWSQVDEKGAFSIYHWPGYVSCPILVLLAVLSVQYAPMGLGSYLWLPLLVFAYLAYKYSTRRSLSFRADAEMIHRSIRL